MSAHEIHALSGAYAVDALDDLERARFEAHLSACATCQAEVDSLSDATLLLAGLVEVAPPAALRAKVLGEIANVRPLPPIVARIERPRPSRWTNLAVAAAVLGVLGASAVVVQNVLSDEAPSQVQSASADIERVLTASDVQHFSAAMPRGASATVFRSYAEHGAVLVTRAMPAAPDNRTYQLWFKKNGRYVPAGLMGSGGDQKVLLNGDPNGATAVGVTIEPKGGSTEPTTAPVALMNFETT